jgi:PAS fold
MAYLGTHVANTSPAGATQAITRDSPDHAVVLADKDGKIEVSNTAAQQLFNLAPDASVGIALSEIPVQPSLGQAFSRKHRAVVERDTPLMLRNQLVHVKRAVHRLDVNFTSISRHRCNADVLVAFMSSPAWDGVVTLCERNNPVDVPPPAENAFQLLADTGCAPYPRFLVKLSGFRELHAPFL